MANLNLDGSKKVEDKQTKGVVNVCPRTGGRILVIMGVPV